MRIWKFSLLLLSVTLNAWADSGERFLSSDCASRLAASKKMQAAVWSYPGGDMRPAELHLFENGLLTIDSEIFSRRKEKRYFLWSMDKNKKIFQLTVCDSRTENFIQQESKRIGKAVRSVDAKTKTIGYAMEKKSIQIGGWYFYAPQP